MGKKIINKVHGTALISWQKLKTFEFNDLKEGVSRDVSKLKNSIVNDGFNFPFYVWKNHNYIIDGNGRNIALNELENEGYLIPELPVVEIEANTKQHAKKLVLLASSSYGKVTQESYDLFIEDINLELEDIELKIENIDFSNTEIQDLEAREDDFEAPEPNQIKTDIVLGDLFEIGEHRLLCGDSTDSDQVTKLMNGEKAEILLTDPPYGIKADKGFGGFGGFGKPIARKQYNDDWDSVRPAQSTFTLILSFCKYAIIFGGNFFADMLPQSKHWLVWDKLNTMPTFGDCELMWTNIERNSVKKYTVEYNGLIGKEKERFHPTQKPIKILSDLITDYSKDTDLILDPYLGSGTTMVAAHQLKRKCYGMELDPKYCQVIVDRMQKLDPTLIIKKNGLSTE